MPIRLESTFKGHSEKAKGAYLEWKKSLVENATPKYHYAGMCTEHIIYALMVNIYKINDFSQSSYYEIQTKNPNYRLKPLNNNEAFGVSTCIHLLKLKGVLKREFHIPIEIIKRNRNDDIHHLSAFFESDLKYTNNWLDNFVTWFTVEVSGESNWRNDVISNVEDKKAGESNKIEIISPKNALPPKPSKSKGNKGSWYTIIISILIFFVIIGLEFFRNHTDGDKLIPSNPTKIYIDKGIDKISGNENNSIKPATKTPSKVDPKFVDEGDNLSKQHKFKEAINKYDMAVSLNPEDASAYVGRGNSKAWLGDYSGAIEDLNIAIRINPNDHESYENRAIAKYGMEDYGGAVADYNEAIRLDPKHAIDYCNRGMAKHNLKEFDSAVADYDKAIQINPNFSKAYHCRGISKYFLNKYQGAKDDFTIYLRMHPTDSLTYDYRGLTEDKLNEYNEAINDFKKSCDLGDSNGCFNYNSHFKQ
jgi:tetratricopeptide (TPR) repeat protein